MNSSNLPLRQLGRNGPRVPRLGLGLMNASGIYNAPLSETDHLALLDDAYSRGETFWDTGMHSYHHIPNRGDSDN
jgi:aryl-alcohol dehydrogenase-like predicted oxidoreductase